MHAINYEIEGAQETRSILQSSLDTVQELTKASADTFKCLEKLQTCKSSTIVSKVAIQSEVYSKVVEGSLVVANDGLAISFNALETFSEGYRIPATTIGNILSDARDMHTKSEVVLANFRALHQKLNVIQQEVDIPYRPNPSLRSPSSNPDALDLTVQALVKLVEVVSQFVNWWGYILVIEKQITQRHMGLAQADCRYIWVQLESEFKAYHSEITRQQAYYVPIRLISAKKSLFGKVGKVATRIFK